MSCLVQVFDYVKLSHDDVMFCSVSVKQPATAAEPNFAHGDNKVEINPIIKLNSVNLHWCHRFNPAIPKHRLNVKTNLGSPT